MVKPDDFTDLQPSEAGVYHDLFADDKFAREACPECWIEQLRADLAEPGADWGRARCKLHRNSVRHD